MNGHNDELNIVEGRTAATLGGSTVHPQRCTRRPSRVDLPIECCTRLRNRIITMSDTLARYAFLPWLRRGIAAKIKEDDNFNVFSPPTGWAMERPEFPLKLKIEGKKGATVGNDEVNQTISLVGPGDVLGVSQKAIVKHDPANWITNYEPNYFPYIEFYEEDFPWRYSPARPTGNKLRPWLMLVVLEEPEFDREDALTGPLPSIKVFSSCLRRYQQWSRKFSLAECNRDLGLGTRSFQWRH